MNPAGSKPPPPEEKLLRLIRGKPVAAAGAPQPSAAGASAGAVAGAIRELSGFPTRIVLAINITLGVIVLGEAGMVVRLLAAPEETIAVPLPKPPASEAPMPPMESTPSLASSVTRPIFEVTTSAPTSATPPPAAATQGPSDQVKLLAARLSIVGVITGARPQAIIQDSQTQTTFTVSVGQRVLEGLMVDEIDANRVVLSLNGEKVELYF